MNSYVKVSESGNYFDVCFYVDEQKIIEIGEKMNDINEYAYMNGYNWEAFFYFFLEINAPDLLEGMKTDPEADMYVAYYDLTPENKKKSEKFAEIITSLIENEEELYQFLRDNGDEIEWD